MNKELPNKHLDSKDSRPPREYSGIQELANNLPYGIMIGLGTAILLVGFGNSTRGWTAASVYLLYGVAGVVWIMIFLCPHCPFFNTRSCPCGYGRIAARLRSKGDDHSFKRKFNICFIISRGSLLCFFILASNSSLNSMRTYFFCWGITINIAFSSGRTYIC